MSEELGFTEHDEGENSQAFLDGMDRLDRLLVSERVPVPGRPLQAIRRIAIARGGGGAIVPETGRSLTSDAVSRWYEERYGNRIKAYFGPGRSVILVRGDPLVLRLPLIIGKGDGIVDVTKILPGLTQPMFASLREGEIQDVVNAFVWMQQRFGAIETLPSPIRANLETAIMQMTSQSPHFGESRWASLQFVEKTMKHFCERGVARQAKLTICSHSYDAAKPLDCLKRCNPS